MSMSSHASDSRSPIRTVLPAVVRTDAFGGALLLVATVAALIVANSGAAGWYESVRDTAFGPEALHLHLTVGQWAADGLLAVFFFVVGLELKEEIVAGRLRSPRAAAVPVAGAVGGVVVPALVFVAFTLTAPGDAARGWAVPTATDIAFAIAVFAVVARRLPPALRVFLLTLAIVDDFIAITIIATVYTDDLQPLWLLVAVAPLTLFAVAVRRGIRSWWILLPLAVTAWALVHASGVHATIAGVLLAFTVPARPTARAHEAPSAHFAGRVGPWSTLVAIPVFAFFAAGVNVGGVDGLIVAMADPITVGVVVGLVIGKPVGILLAVFLVTRAPSMRAAIPAAWPDLVGVGFLAGIGFTVALLVAELSYGAGSPADDHAKIGILVGSLVSAVVGGGILAARSRRAGRAGVRS